MAGLEEGFQTGLGGVAAEGAHRFALKRCGAGGGHGREGPVHLKSPKELE
jgi:hypothetical protein